MPIMIMLFKKKPEYVWNLRITIFLMLLFHGQVVQRLKLLLM
jgi:hypothetical protein